MSYKANRQFWLSGSSHNVYRHLLIQRTVLMAWLKRHSDELTKAAVKK